MSKLLTVITSTYNKGERNRESIQSVLNQTYSEFQYIVINDESPDNTSEILDEFHDSRLKIINQKNRGFVKTMVSIMQEIKTPYVAIQGAGDVSLPQRFEEQINYLKAKPEVGAVASYVSSTFVQKLDLTKEIQHHSRQSKKYQEIECKYPEQLLKKNIIDQGSVMMRMSAYCDVGGYRPFFHYCQDFDLWLRILEKYPIVKMNRVLYVKVSDAQADIYGNPGKAECQTLYSLFARNLAYERKASGTDSLEEHGEAAFISFKQTITEAGQLEIVEKVAMNSLNSQYGINEALEIIEKYKLNHPSIRSLKLLRLAKSISPYGGLFFSGVRRIVNKSQRISSKIFSLKFSNLA